MAEQAQQKREAIRAAGAREEQLYDEVGRARADDDRRGQAMMTAAPLGLPALKVDGVMPTVNYPTNLHMLSAQLQRIHALMEDAGQLHRFPFFAPAADALRASAAVHEKVLLHKAAQAHLRSLKDGKVGGGETGGLDPILARISPNGDLVAEAGDSMAQGVVAAATYAIGQWHMPRDLVARLAEACHAASLRQAGGDVDMDDQAPASGPGDEGDLARQLSVASTRLQAAEARVKEMRDRAVRAELSTDCSNAAAVALKQQAEVAAARATALEGELATEKATVATLTAQLNRVFMAWKAKTFDELGDKFSEVQRMQEQWDQREHEREQAREREQGARSGTPNQLNTPNKGSGAETSQPDK